MQNVRIPLAFLILLLALRSGAALAQSGGGYDLARSTIAGSYARSSGGSFELGGIIGQPDAGALSGGVYTLIGGFLHEATPHYPTFLPLTLRNTR